MASIKKLASQTLWYGASSIFARFLYYLLTPYLTYKFAGTSEYGRMSLIFSIIPFLYTLILFAFETAYFRFITIPESSENIYDTLFTSLIINTLIICGLTYLFRDQLAAFIGLANHSDYVSMAALIIGLDAVSALPFAKMRHDNRPRKFAMIRIASIFVNIGVTYFFLSICPDIVKKNPNSVFQFIYNPKFGAGYVLVGNIAASLFQVIALYKEIGRVRLRLNVALWKQVMTYALPLTIAGFAGMINETFDRIMLQKWTPLKGEAAIFEVGIYAACYRLSILITLFVQAFRMGAEPFFFKTASEENAPRTYARVMKFFVIAICVMFLVVALYIDIWKQFIRDPKMWEGLKVVPILLFANMFLGIYINLSIWYRLSRKTTAGAIITLIGAGITLVINYLFIPHFGYLACAWATFLCYGTMMVISYLQGQKAYPVPYAWKKLCAYMAIVAILYLVHHGLTTLFPNRAFSYTLATVFLALFSLFVYRIEEKEFVKLFNRKKTTAALN